MKIGQIENWINWKLDKLKIGQIENGTIENGTTAVHCCEWDKLKMGQIENWTDWKIEKNPDFNFFFFFQIIF